MKINVNDGRIQDTFRRGNYGEVYVQDRGMSANDEQKLKLNVKNEMAMQLVPDIVGFFDRSFGEHEPLKQVMTKYVGILANVQREATMNSEFGKLNAVSAQTLNALFEEYRELRDTILEKSRMQKLSALGRIMQNLFSNPEVLNNLTGAGLLTMEDAGLVGEFVTDQSLPLDYLTTLTATFVEFSVYLTKAMAYESNTTANPAELAHQLIDAISKSSSKDDLERAQLLVMENYGLIRKGDSGMYMANQNVATYSQAARIANLAQKPQYLWADNDWELKSAVDLYLTTGQLPADTFTSGVVQNHPVAPQQHERVPNAMIMDPNKPGDGFMTYQTQNGTYTGNAAFQQVINASSGLAIDKGDKGPISQNLVTPNPQARAMFAAPADNIVKNNYQYAAQPQVQPQVQYATQQQVQPQVQVQQQHWAQPQTQPVVQQQYVTQQQVHPGTLSNIPPAPANMGYPTAATQQYATQSVTPMIVLPNNSNDERVNVERLFMGNIVITDFSPGTLDPSTNSKILKITNNVTGTVDLCSEMFYNHIVKYYSNMSYKTQYDNVLRQLGVYGKFRQYNLNINPYTTTIPTVANIQSNIPPAPANMGYPTAATPQYVTQQQVQPQVQYATQQQVQPAVQVQQQHWAQPVVQVQPSAVNSMGYASNDPLVALNNGPQTWAQPQAQGAPLSPVGLGLEHMIVSLPGML